MGADFGLAEGLIQGATRCFRTAVERNPGDTKALGNLGNVLLAHGELKKAIVDELQAGLSGKCWSILHWLLFSTCPCGIRESVFVDNLIKRS